MKTTLRRCALLTASVVLAMAICHAQAAKPALHAVLLMGGDVQWSLTLRPATVLYGNDEPPDENWRPSPYLNEGPSKAEYQKLGSKPTVPNHDDIAIRYDLHFSSAEEMLHYPFQSLKSTLGSADFVFFNLETPLSDTAPMMGEARTPEQFAQALRWAGSSVVTIANNHTFDADQQGFLDTMRSLSAAGLPYIGGGHDLEEARKPVILEHNGIKIGFIGYAQFSNMGEPAFAAEGRPGIAPMDPLLIEEDIRKLRPLVNYVAVSIHWGNDKSANVSPTNRKLAHELIDAGADIILGHHTPFPKGIEVYKGKVIVYSPAHVFIGHNHPEWGDDYLLRFTLGSNAVEKIEVLPIAGEGKLLAQPFLLHGEEARDLLEKVRTRTAALDTKMEIAGDSGVILPQGKP